MEEGEIGEEALSDISDAEFLEHTAGGFDLEAGGALWARNPRVSKSSGLGSGRWAPIGTQTRGKYRSHAVAAPLTGDDVPVVTVTSGQATPKQLGDEDDDIDEDELYLRLIALRSMAPDSPPSSATADQEVMASEMIDLLDEAEAAAQAPEITLIQPVGSGGISPRLIRKLKRSLEKLQAQDNPSYSPSQSPILGGSPADQTASSPGDLTPSLSEADGGGSPPQSPPSTPPPPPPYPGPKPKISLVPVDQLVAEVAQSAPPNLEPVDMELGSDNEAEVQFFKDQREQDSSLFPTSVWAFQSGGNVVKRAKRLRRKSLARRPDVITISGEDPEIVALSSEDEDDLFAQAFSSMRARKLEKHQKTDKTEASTVPTPWLDPSPLPELPPESVDLRRESDRKRARVRVPKQVRLVQELASGRSSPLSPKSLPPSTEGQHRLLVDIEVRKKHFPNLFRPFIITVEDQKYDQASEGEEVERRSVRSQLFDMSLDHFLKESRQKVDTKRKRKKPHRSHKLTPPPKPARKNPPGLGKSVFSPAEKATLMRSSIQHLTTAKQLEYKKLKEIITKKEAIKKEKTKLASFEKAKHAASRGILKPGGDPSVPDVPVSASNGPPSPQSTSGPVSTSDTLSTSSLPLMPITSTTSATKTSLPPPEKKSLPLVVTASVYPKTNKISPMSVIKSPRGSPEGGQASVILSAKSSSENNPNGANLGKPPKDLLPTKSSMKVSINSNGRNVSMKWRAHVPLGALSCPPKDDAPPTLEAKECELVAAREVITGSLFKLSAEMSHFRNEKTSRDETIKLVNDLKARVREAEDLLFKKESQVENIRLSIMNSQELLLNRNAHVKGLEDECEMLGRATQGSNGTYVLPSKYSNIIQKKLSSIAANASSMKAAPQNSSDLLLGVAPSGKSLPSVGSSVLAHMVGSQGGRPTNSWSKVDPHKTFCPFDLAGQCNDAKCSYQHMDK
eukprot:maker-scaffold240_size241964-snap-gene-1.17 protein:Tk08271 transcript:maker-scaffold240_size241964-snap-gene-1.17-mRNA-1 annotation:"hypothetical protein EAI_14499"